VRVPARDGLPSVAMAGTAHSGAQALSDEPRASSSECRPGRGRAPRPVAALGAALVLLTGCNPRRADAPAPPTPDFVLVVVDTLRADHLGLYGHDRPTSPELDAWAAGGTVFERAYAGSSWTVPSMAMLFTGLVRSTNQARLDPAQPTLTDLLSEAGFHCAAVISNKLLDRQKGWDRGFDSFELYELPRRGPALGWYGDEVVDRGLAARAAAPLDRPLFLFLMLFDPHQPYLPVDRAFAARPSAERRAALAAQLPEGTALEDWAYTEIEERRALYEAEVAQADRALGRLFAALEARRGEREVLVVLTADHGEGLWQRASPPDAVVKDKGPVPELYGTHGALLHEEQLHVPLVWRGPGIPAGARIPEAVANLDLMPTVGRRLGLDLPPLDGVDLFDPAARAARRELPAFIARGAGLLFDGRWRLHLPGPARQADYGLGPELYDLDADPGETTPLDDPQLLLDLTARLERWRASRAGPADPEETLDREALERLGYTGGEADRPR
jgi:arylsulfatase